MSSVIWPQLFARSTSVKHIRCSVEIMQASLSCKSPSSVCMVETYRANEGKKNRGDTAVSAAEGSSQ